MVPHVDVHGGRHDDRRGSSEIERGEKIAGDALREVGQNIGRGRSDYECVNRLRDRDVLDGGLNIGLMLFASRKHSGDDFFTGQSGEGERANKLLSSAGHHDLHADTTVLQQADQFCRFVGCDSAGNSEGDLHTIEIADF